MFRYYFSNCLGLRLMVVADSLEQACEQVKVRTVSSVRMSYYREPVDNDKSRRVLINEEER